MATKMESLHLEIAHFKNFYRHIDVLQNKCADTIDAMLTLGIIEVSTTFEYALANVKGCKVISEDYADLDDGNDAKLSSVRTSNKGSAYSAPISGIHNKTGDLKVQVYERKQHKFYYFVIPNNEFVTMSEKSNIEIPFELNGDPRRVPRGRRKWANWWDFEVNDFHIMANA